MLIIKRAQRSGDAESHRACLAARTTTLDIRNDIILPKGIGDFERLEDIGSEGLN